jgi:lambda family phage portal protein
MNWKFWKKDIDNVITETEEVLEQPAPSSILFIGNGRVGYNPILDDVFDGEKTPGELGSVYDTVPDHLRLRLRAYDMNLKTDIVKIITGKFFKWVIGSGLKLQSEPNEVVLEMSGIDPDTTNFKKQAEALFGLYADSKYSDYNRIDWLHEKASEAFKTAFLGGDVLCVIRFDNYGPNIQVIDGQQVSNPLNETGKEEGNIIKHGIELNKKGEHVAFWVSSYKDDGSIDHKRIKALSSTGILMAWMIYGNKERIDHHRGIPVISSILEKIAKLDRFVEASVTKAEQTANVVYAFKHNDESTGENILTQQLSSKKTTDETEETTFEKNGRTAAMLRQTTSGTVMNLTPGSDLISLSNSGETSFNEFFRAVFVCLCASVDIPEEVALQKYEQNYSSSRAAINGWEHIVEIYRQKFAKKFYEPFYRSWLEYQVLKGKIKAPGFLEAQANNDFMALEAYFNARFTGKKMPHIDPLKEAKAIRTMLGENTTALISFEQATEAMGSGDWNSNYKKHLEEKKIVPVIKEEKPNNI